MVYGYSEADQKKLNKLKTLVSLRVDEYSEQADEIGDNDINLGDIAFELDNSAREVLSAVERDSGFRAARDITDYSAVIAGNHEGGRVPLPDDYLRFTSMKMQNWSLPVNQLISDQSRAYRQQQYEYRRGTPEQPKAFLVPMREAAYEAGVVPNLTVLCTVKTEPVDQKYISVGAAVTITHNTGTVAGTIEDLSDPDYIHVSIDSLPGDLEVGDVVDSDSDNWQLTVKYIPGQTFTRPGFKQAIEFWPNKSGDEIESLLYIPYLKAVEMPEELEDALVWYTAYKVLAIAERFESAKMVYQQYQQAVINVNKGFKGEGRGDAD